MFVISERIASQQRLEIHLVPLTYKPTNASYLKTHGGGGGKTRASLLDPRPQPKAEDRFVHQTVVRSHTAHGLWPITACGRSS